MNNKPTINPQIPYASLWERQLKQYANKPKQLENLQQRIAKYQENILEKQNLATAIKIVYPDNLPVSQEIENIKNAIKASQVVIVCGDTGSGKSTQLPKALLELGYGIYGQIGHTQPRRIAAKSLAHRLSEEMECAHNHFVGYKIRFHDKANQHTAIKVMTDGILLQEIQNDKLLLQYDALIIDEVHERSINIDFILGYLHQILARCPDFKVIITSATVDSDKFSKFFTNAPMLNVAGKTYPVDIIYQPYFDDDNEISLNQAIYQAISSCFAIERGNVLVFLPGEREIKDALRFLNKTTLNGNEILALYSRQAMEVQNKVFIQTGRVKIILTTNVAETSLTIPNVKYVIDSGLARVKRYSVRNKVEQLLLEPISQASAKQRAGRAGRQSHGMCVRLYAEAEFNLRPQYNDPEILRSNLANVILKLLSLGLGGIEQFKFIDEPESKAFNDGFRTLMQIKAIDSNQQISSIGREIVHFPMDVQLARSLQAASTYNALHEALIISSFLAIADPREFILEHQQIIQERQSIWKDPDSELVTILKLWDWYHDELKHKHNNKKMLELCHKYFLSYVRMREWLELYAQLKELMSSLNYKLNEHPASYQELHQAFLSGFPINLGQKDIKDNFYLGTNSKKFLIHPGALIKPVNKWIMALNLVETTRLYARMCAKIDPIWLNGIADHLYKFTYSNEHWSKKRGAVMARQDTLLYGLLIQSKDVLFSKINSALARELFIKGGLVESQMPKVYKFMQYNEAMINKIYGIEDKLRTEVLLLDEELFAFYDEILPADVCDVVSLDKFIASSPDALKIDYDGFVSKLSVLEEKINLYPDVILINKQKLRLKYLFEHGSDEDGVTALIELKQLANLEDKAFGWLVAGMIRDKVAYLIKVLPKNQRLRYNPSNEFISEFLESANLENDFLLEFSSFSKQKLSLELDYSTLCQIEFPTALRFHYNIIEDKKVLAHGDNLAKLKQELQNKLDKVLINTESKIVLEGWHDCLEHLFEQDANAYNSLAIQKDKVVFAKIAKLEQSLVSTASGLKKLVLADMSVYRKQLAKQKSQKFIKISLNFAKYYPDKDFNTVLMNYLCSNMFDIAYAEIIPRMLKNKQKFSQVIYLQLITRTKELVADNLILLNTALFNASESLAQINNISENHSLEEIINEQLDELIFEDFLAYTKFCYLQNYPRYLQAIIIRLQKYSKSVAKDSQIQTEIDAIYERWYFILDDLEAKHKTIAQELYDFKYKIEELKISLFAQEVKTLYPVSAKRLLTDLDRLYNDCLVG